jgi:hypothetical protein
MIYTTPNHYYNNLKNLKILAPANYWRRQNIGVNKIERLQILAQEKVSGDAEELPHC